MVALVACSGCIDGASELDTPMAQEQAHRSAGAGETRWVRRSVGALVQQGYDVAVDREGNSTLVGAYLGTPDFGAGPLPAVPSGALSGFIARYSPEGTLRWARGFAFASFEAVTVDRHRHITVVGRAAGSVDLDGTPVTGTIFLAQFDEDGSVRWVRSLDAIGVVSPLELAADSQGNLLFAGAMLAPVDFGGGSRAVDLQGSAFLAKYRSDGRYLWDRVFDTQGRSVFDGVTTDSDDNVYIAGYFSGQASFGGSTLNAPPGGTAPVVVAYSPSGAHRWSRVPMGLSGEALLFGIAVHGNRVVATGQFQGTLSFRGKPFFGSAPAVGLVLAYTRSGEERWGKSLGLGIVDVAADHQDNMTVLGFAQAGDDVGTGPLPTNGFFVLKLDRVQGTSRWVRSFTGGNVLAPFALDVTREGESVTGGYFSGTADFGTGPLTADSDDAFLLRLRP